MLDEDNLTPGVYTDDSEMVFKTTERQLLDHHFGFFITGVIVEMPSSPVLFPESATGIASADAGATAFASGRAASTASPSTPQPRDMTLSTTQGATVRSTTGDREALFVARALIEAGVPFEQTPEGIFFEEIPPGVSIGPLPPGVSLERFQLDEPDAVGSMTADEDTPATL